LKDLVLLREVLVELENGRDVPAAIAVVRRAPDGDERAVEHELVALHRELVRARDQRERVLVCEPPRDVRAEQEARAARREAPAGDVCAQEDQRVRNGWNVRKAPSGSDQSRSHIGPSCGTSCLRSMARIYAYVNCYPMFAPAHAPGRFE
jgi:hypothetical protein